MTARDEHSKATKDCERCGGRAFYWRTAIIPGDPLAPRGSNRAAAHSQPAWTCMNCGYIEPHDRRGRAAVEPAGRPRSY
jgi:hypothetical protein